MAYLEIDLNIVYLDSTIIKDDRFLVVRGLSLNSNIEIPEKTKKTSPDVIKSKVSLKKIHKFFFYKKTF